jgi:sugar phosphate isomerase/epimerase
VFIAMDLKVFKTLWGFNGSYPQAIEEAVIANMHGIEGPAPGDSMKREQLLSILNDNQLGYIAEITTAGSYVPERHASLEDHLQSFATKLEYSLHLKPLFITCLGGCDAWPEAQSVEFFSRAIELANAANVLVSFETHRSRSMFNPWVTQRLVEQIPDIRLTCDFSHWCVVCERLMDSEIHVIQAIADNAHHIHARVGYDQGPQVPHPAAPEYEPCLRSHQSWWEIIWRSQIKRQYSVTTITPEFGPDGYLHQMPFTKQPVADLWELNTWMAKEEINHFASFNNATK